MPPGPPKRPRPAERRGRKDITAHVNFTGIALAGREAGWQVLGYTSQGRFLSNCGLLDSLAHSPDRLDSPCHRLQNPRRRANAHHRARNGRVVQSHWLCKGPWFDAMGFAKEIAPTCCKARAECMPSPCIRRGNQGHCQIQQRFCTAAIMSAMLQQRPQIPDPRRGRGPAQRPARGADAAPCPANTGIVFRRVDLAEPVDIPVNPQAVCDCRMATTISPGATPVRPKSTPLST